MCAPDFSKNGPEPMPYEIPSALSNRRRCASGPVGAPVNSNPPSEFPPAAIAGAIAESNPLAIGGITAAGIPGTDGTGPFGKLSTEPNPRPNPNPAAAPAAVAAGAVGIPKASGKFA